VNKDSNLNKKAYINISACLNSLGDRTEYTSCTKLKKKKTGNTLNFMPSGVTCDIRIRKHKKSRLLRINSLMSYSTYFSSTA